jgi:threonine dehydrogenase-like Zn-dependent dehydrogenase
MFVCSAVRRPFAGISRNLIDLVFAGKINPSKVFDLVLPLDRVAEGYRAMDERRAIKTLLRAQGN